MSDDRPPPDEQPTETAEDAPANEEGAPPPAAAGVEGPSFVAKYPKDPALQALVTAFTVGNYALVRRDGPKLARATDSDDVRAAARELVRRTDPDPLAKWFMIGAAGLLTFLALWFWTHGHAG